MDNQVHNQIVSFIWGIADDCLRDVYVRGKYRDVILPMTVIRRLDAMLESTKPAVLEMKTRMDDAGITNQYPALCNAAGQAFCNSSPFLLKDLTSRAKKQTLKVDFEEYLDGFSPNVREILDKFKFRNQIDTMIEADILSAVIEKFVSPAINLSPNPIYTDDTMQTVKLPALDNHGMGTIFEELIRRFNEENNEEAGEHWTPRDVVELMADLVFIPVADQIKDATYSCYDGACGTGGMLTVAQDRLLTLAKQRGKNVSIHLFGQEINPETYAIAKADLLLKGDGEQAEHISYGSTLSLDGNAARQFDFMLSNPPYGKSWKIDAEKMGGKKDILDSRFNAYPEDGEQLAMIPRTSDGQLLFLLNNVAKMKKDTELGSRIAEVHNGSSIFTGGAGSGESNARRYMIENDLVEAVIALPENMFYNTGIGTFIWVLSNRKEERRKGKIQLIDATAMKSPLRKNMGKKNCEFTPEIKSEILRIFLEMEESEVSMIFNNEEFGYWNVTVERPLRLRICPDRTIPIDTFKKSDEYDSVCAAIQAAVKTAPLDDWTAFAKATKLKAAVLKKVRPFITEKDPAAKAIDGEADTDLRDTENIPFTYEGGIDAFIKNEVLTYAPDAYVDEKKTKIGYEIRFTKYFQKKKNTVDIKLIQEKIDRIQQVINQQMQYIDPHAYPSYKKISEYWLTHIPSHWKAVKIKFLFDERSEKGYPDEPLLAATQNMGVVPKNIYGQRTVEATKDLELLKLVRKDDFVISLRSFQGGIERAYYQGIISPAYTIMVPRGISVNYFKHLAKSRAFIDLLQSCVTGIREGQNIDYGMLKNIRIPVPPIDEQEQIAKYLDSINARINARINEISLLKQYRDSIMSGIVTGETDIRNIEIPEYEFVEEIAYSLDEDNEDMAND
ncbi:MAG: N-6 DNA methylase [Eubacterium sp.]|nr:N-6 DNA methylase [Eubacterium sp.]